MITNFTEVRTVIIKESFVYWRSLPHVRMTFPIAMKKYVCDVCGYVYDPAVGDPDSGIAPGTAFEDLPADWVCPLCGVGKDQFSPEA